jgi:hypothetical protein
MKAPVWITYMGDVTDGEFEAACYYEYGRESHVLHEAARLSRQELDLSEIGHRIDRHFACGNLFLASPWLEIFTCGLFPETPWNRLHAEVRAGILGAFPLPSGKVQALRMIDLRRLDNILDRLKEKVLEQAKLLDQLKRIGKRARANRKAHQRVLPILHVGQWSHVLFTVDHGKTRKQLIDEFEAFLELPEMIKARSAKYRGDPTGKTGKAKDRLKDLAASRLYEYCKRDWNAANDFADNHRKQTDAGEARTFHDVRKGKDAVQPKDAIGASLAPQKDPANKALLYSGQLGFLRARKRAQIYLKQLIPWEFYKQGKDAELENLRAKMKKRFRKKFPQEEE